MVFLVENKGLVTYIAALCLSNLDCILFYFIYMFCSCIKTLVYSISFIVTISALVSDRVTKTSTLNYESHGAINFLWHTWVRRAGKTQV